MFEDDDYCVDYSNVSMIAYSVVSSIAFFATLYSCRKRAVAQEVDWDDASSVSSYGSDGGLGMDRRAVEGWWQREDFFASLEYQYDEESYPAYDSEDGFSEPDPYEESGFSRTVDLDGDGDSVFSGDEVDGDSDVEPEREETPSAFRVRYVEGGDPFIHYGERGDDICTIL